MVSKMKKIALILSLILLISLLSACGTEDELPADTTVTNSTTQAQNVEIEISKDTLAEAEEFLKNMESYGAEVKDEADSNSYILTFSAEEHQKLLDDKYAETIKAFKEFENDQNNYVEKVEFDNNFRNITISVNRELYDVISSEVREYAVGAKALAYQLYANEEQHTNIKIVYSETEELVGEFEMPINFIGQ